MKKYLSMIILISSFIISPTVFADSTITVNSNADNQVGGDGFCTLREAVQNANINTDITGGDCTAGSGVDTIIFANTMTIQLGSNIVIMDPAILDGTSNGVTGTCSTKSLGVVIDGSGGISVDPFIINDLGSGTTIKGFVINNSDHGITIDNSDNNKIQCNIFGLDETGLVLVENTNSGINITAGSLGNIIGGLLSGDGNIVAGSQRGIQIFGANDTEIYGNVIGLNINGDAAFSVQTAGIEMGDSDGTIIGGSTAAHRNIISGSQNNQFSSGLNINGLSDNTTIQGNYFGTDITGLISIPNNNKNIEVCDNSGCTGYGEGPIGGILIGGESLGQGNIFGPTTNASAISMGSEAISNVVIKRNWFGIGSDGVTLLGTGSSGWLVSQGVSGLTIGGELEDEGNVFSSYNAESVLNVNGGENVTIAGNIVGFLPDGITETGDFAEDGDNIISINEVASDLYFGLPSQNGGNVVAGNSSQSLVAFINTNTNFLFQNNRIGLNKNDQIIPSTGIGVAFLLSNDGVMGGYNEFESNKIAGFQSSGIFILTSAISIINNEMMSNATSVTIADTVLVPGISSQTSLLQNSISSSGIAIDLAKDLDGDILPETDLGINPNDTGDADEGPNGYLNAPIIHSVDWGVTTYSLDVPVGTYRVEFFATGDVGQADTYVDYDTFVSEGQSKQQIITLDLSGVDNDDHISATVTEDFGEGVYGATSELSQEYVPLSEVTTITMTTTSSGMGTPWKSISAPVNNSNNAPTSTSSTDICSIDQILTQNLRAGARNGKYHPYTKAIVTEVKILQAHMNRLGFNSGKVDGILGPVTDKAIKRMQAYLGTWADGLVGPKTRALINKSCGVNGLQKN